MTDKIQELTEKIYNEGVDKAKVDADKIIEEAKKEAGKIIQDGKKQREEMLNQAKKEAAELKKNTDAEMQLAARQFISHVKQQITNAVMAKQVEAPIKEAFNDSEFLKNLILTLVKNWNLQSQEQVELRLLISEKEADNLSAFFESKAFSSLNKNIDIQWDEKTKNGFKIGPRDGSYIIRFSDIDFENYFKKYFKERTRNLLFGTQEENS
jgi:V/A-type H+/Na+-transporting ATPase subunit E